jgi:hypothetical protein
MWYPRRWSDSYADRVVEMPPSCGAAMSTEGRRRERRDVDWVWVEWIEGEWTPVVSADRMSVGQVQGEAE